MRRVCERPRTSTPSARQEKGVRKMRWPRSPAKNRLSGAAAAEGREKAQLRHADVLGLVDDAELERRMRPLRDMPLQMPEQAGLGEQPPFVQAIAHPGEDRPEHRTLRFRQAGLAAQPHDIPVVLPAFELPRIDHLAPLGPQEVGAERVPPDLGGRQVDQRAHLTFGDQGRRPEVRLVEAPADAAHRVHLQPLGDAGLVVDQAPEPHAQRVRQRVGEGGEEDAGIGMRAGEMNGAVERHDGLSGAGRAGDAGRAAVCVLHDSALRRMQEDRPLLPRELERALQLVGVLDQAEPALSVGVSERIRVGGRGSRPVRHATGSGVDCDVLHDRLHDERRPLRRATGCDLQQRFRRLGRQVVGEIEQGVLVRAAHVVHPRLGHAVAQQLVVGGTGKKRRL